jgi:hypothetical protein
MGHLAYGTLILELVGVLGRTIGRIILRRDGGVKSS